jgi:hypothetical protein
MDFEQALRQRLLDDAAVGAIAGARIEWGVRPQGQALPGVVLVLISEPDTQRLDRAQAMVEARVQIDCRATSRAQTVALRKAVKAALRSGGTFNGARFGRGLFSDVRDLSEPLETGVVHRDSFDILVMHD